MHPFEETLEEIRTIFRLHACPTGQWQHLVDLPLRLSQDSGLRYDLTQIVLTLQRSKLNLPDVLDLLIVAVGGNAAQRHAGELSEQFNLLGGFLSGLGHWPAESFEPVLAPGEVPADLHKFMRPPAPRSVSSQGHTSEETPRPEPARPERFPQPASEEVARNERDRSRLSPSLPQRSSPQPGGAPSGRPEPVPAPTAPSHPGDPVADIARALSRLERGNLELRAHLDSIDQRISRMEPRLESSAPSLTSADVETDLGGEPAIEPEPPTLLHRGVPPSPSRAPAFYPEPVRLREPEPVRAAVPSPNWPRTGPVQTSRLRSEPRPSNSSRNDPSEGLPTKSLWERAPQERTIQEPTIQDRPLQERPLQERPLQERPLQERTIQDPTMQERTPHERNLQGRTLEERTVPERTVPEQTAQEPTPAPAPSLRMMPVPAHDARRRNSAPASASFAPLPPEPQLASQSAPVEVPLQAPQEVASVRPRYSRFTPVDPASDTTSAPNIAGPRVRAADAPQVIEPTAAFTSDPSALPSESQQPAERKPSSLPYGFFGTIPDPEPAVPSATAQASLSDPELPGRSKRFSLAATTFLLLALLGGAGLLYQHSISTETATATTSDIAPSPAPRSSPSTTANRPAGDRPIASQGPLTATPTPRPSAAQLAVPNAQRSSSPLPRNSADLPASGFRPAGTFVPAPVMEGHLLSAPVPQAARDLVPSGIATGLVTLEVNISGTGEVEDIHILGGNSALRPAAIETVRNWKYRPYLLNGTPVEVRTIVRVDLSPHRAEPAETGASFPQ